MVCPSGVKAIGSNIPGLVSTVPPAVKLPWVLRTIGLPSSALLGSFSSALTGMQKIDAPIAASTTLVMNARLNPRSGAFFARTSSSCFMFSSRKRIAIGRSSCSGPERRQLLEARRHRLIRQPQRRRRRGASFLACQLDEQLELDRFWTERLPDSRKGTQWRYILQTLVCYRLIDPGSEWRLHWQWFE